MSLCSFQSIAFVFRNRIQIKLISKNSLNFFASQYFHTSSRQVTQYRSNVFRTNFSFPKQRLFLRPSKSLFANSLRKISSPAKTSVLKNGSLRGNSINQTSQLSKPAVAATNFTKPIVGYWLLGTAGLVFGIVILGGLTRLTESGLSIVEWKPITGIIPPLTNVQWEEEFEKYKQFPEYKL